MIKISAFAASCAAGNSHTAEMADRVADAIRKKAAEQGKNVEYERMTGADVRIDYCRYCINCFTKGFCPLDSHDDCGMLKQRILYCDIFLFGTPVYLWQMSGIAKSLLDRISYWTHRFELIVKPCVTFSTTDTSRGREVPAELTQLMSFTGAVMTDGGCSTGISGMEKDPAEIAEKALALYRDPASGVSIFQQRAFLCRVILTTTALSFRSFSCPRESP